MAMTDGGTPAATPAPAPTDAPMSLEQVDQLLNADRDSEQGREPEPEQTEVAAASSAPPPAEPPKDEPAGDLRVPLREERERRRQAEQAVQDLTNQQRQLAAALAQVAPHLLPKKDATPSGPDWETDPAGYLKESISELKQSLATVRKQQEEQAQDAQQKQAFEMATRAVSDLERSFVQQTPDYYDALDFVRNKWRARSEVLGVPKEQVDLVVKEQLQRLGLISLQTGVNPAERLFALAKVEGYTGSKESASAKLDTIAKGQQSAKAQRSSAPASDGATTIEDAVRLSVKAFQKMTDEEFQRLAGG